MNTSVAMLAIVAVVNEGILLVKSQCAGRTTADTKPAMVTGGWVPINREVAGLACQFIWVV